MTKIRFCIAVVFTVLSIGVSAFAQESQGGIPAAPDEKTMAAARHLLDVSGSSKTGERIWASLMEELKRSQPSVPLSAWEDLDREFRGLFSSDDFLNKIAAVYARHFTEDELKQLAAFYESPIGKKFVENLPDIAQESFQVGSEAGRDAVKRALDRLKEKGYKTVTD